MFLGACQKPFLDLALAIWHNVKDDCEFLFTNIEIHS